MSDIVERLAPCPFCGETLEIRQGRNPYGRHAKDSQCLLAGRAINIPYDVEGWNRRSDATISALREEVEEARKERDNTLTARDVATETQNDLSAALLDVEAALTALRQRVVEVVKLAIPRLDDNFRWHRDMQSHAGNVMAAHEALEAARALHGELTQETT